MATPWAKATCATLRAQSTLLARPRACSSPRLDSRALRRDYVARSPKRIVLIDGLELARLMVQHGVGVRTRVRHEIKRIDEDYFDQEAM